MPVHNPLGKRQTCTARKPLNRWPGHYISAYSCCIPRKTTMPSPTHAKPGTRAEVPPPERLLHASQPSMHVHVPGLTASSAEASPSQGHCHTASRPTTHALGPISSQQQPDLPIDTTTQLASPHMPALKPTAAQRWSYLPLRDTAAQLAGSLHPQIPSSRTSLVKGSLL